MSDFSAHDDLAMVDYARVHRLLLLADDPEQVQAVQAAADQASCRLLLAPLRDGAERLGEAGGYDAIFLSLLPDAVDEAGPLLDALDRLGERYRCVLQAPVAAIDRLAAIGIGPARMLAAKADHEELVEMLDWLMADDPDQLHDSGKGASRLQKLSQDAERLASELAALSEAAPEQDGGDDSAFDAVRVRAIIRARRLRDQFFGPNLFADPAWDMLLDLMAARLEGQHVAVSSLCIAAAVPATTALRWIKVLTDQGLFVRVADPQDGRRIHIELADQAAAALDAYLRTAQRISSIPG